MTPENYSLPKLALLTFLFMAVVAVGVSVGFWSYVYWAWNLVIK